MIYEKYEQHANPINVLVEQIVFIDRGLDYANSSHFARVIEISNCPESMIIELIRFLQMACKTLRERKIDTELAYAYAKTDLLHDIEDFLAITNIVDILEVGEECFEDQLYQAAKLLFTSIFNWARFATTLIYLGENEAAVESARKTQCVHFCKALCLAKCFQGLGSRFMLHVSRKLSSDRQWFLIQSSVCL